MRFREDNCFKNKTLFFFSFRFSSSSSASAVHSIHSNRNRRIFRQPKLNVLSLFRFSSHYSFRIDNTDHIIDVNKDNSVFEYDQVNIMCPKHDSNVPEDETEKYIILNVSKEEYETCQVRDLSRARIIAQCNKPYQSMYFTITFRSFTPQPGGLEFRPGQDYYFIAAPEDHRGENHCLTKNMRVQFKVCCKKGTCPTCSSLSLSLPLPRLLPLLLLPLFLIPA